MQNSEFLGLSGRQIHSLVHGNTLSSGLNWSGPLGGLLKFHYGTPMWFKTSLNFGGSKALNSIRQ